MRAFKRDRRKKRLPPYLTPPVAELCDELLLQAITDGNVNALEVLYDRYHCLLYSLAYYMVADQHVAEDLLQDTFLTAWSQSSNYTTKSGSVRNWLVTIIHHRTIHYLRNLRRGSSCPGILLKQLEQHEATIVEPDALPQAWFGVQNAQVREALMRLSPEQRIVIELVYFQGWTYTEVAAGCELPLGTVKARMRLGLMHLKHMLTEIGVQELS